MNGKYATLIKRLLFDKIDDKGFTPDLADNTNREFSDLFGVWDEQEYQEFEQPITIG